ncbi:MAG: hypothetical protein CM1200mP28_06000 [Deltaproteobacteria bacterium]|nr:MAG: hypothetical protein CM1200mP28_06000 [Deltaproteobacteria bacterium]
MEAMGKDAENIIEKGTHEVSEIRLMQESIFLQMGNCPRKLYSLPLSTS